MKWATRAGVHIDRAASAWLIRSRIDPDAVFTFIGDLDDLPDDATPFDIRGAALGHHNGDCTFETILRHYDLADPILWQIAGIIHQADLDDDRYDAPEAAGLDVTIRGLSMICDDHHVLDLTAPLFDGLYTYKRQHLLLGREPA